MERLRYKESDEHWFFLDEETHTPLTTEELLDVLDDVDEYVERLGLD